MRTMELPKTARPIKGAVASWVDVDGEVYSLDTRSKRKQKITKRVQSTWYGYKYCAINYPSGQISKRVHRLVAEAFIPNPDNLPVVGHRNNIKDDNRVENLYWTTYQENTQKAVDDGLLVNDKGYDDNQSKPVNMYNTYTNQLLGSYGSIIEASETTGLSKTTIARQAKYKRPVRRPYYFRYQDDPDCIGCPGTVGMYAFDTDELEQVFYNTSDASKQTGVSDKTIMKQCRTGRKPKVRRSDHYFLHINNN